MWYIKLLPVTLADCRGAGYAPATLFPIWFLLMAWEKTWKITHVFGPLPVMWEAWTKLLVLDYL